RIAGFGDRYPNSAEAGDMIIAHVREKIAFIDTHDNVDKLARFIAERTGYPRASGPRKKVGVNKPAISELSKQNRKMLESLNIADYALFHYLKKECRQTQNDPFESKPSEDLIDLPR